MSAMDLEQAIAAQVQSTPPESVTELILDACKATKVTGIDKFINLEMLTLNGCGLTSLEGFPTLPNLKTLELADNQLGDGCLEALQDAALLNLTRLSLAGNRFSTLDALEPLVRAGACPTHRARCRTPTAPLPLHAHAAAFAQRARVARTRARCRAGAWLRLRRQEARATAAAGECGALERRAHADRDRRLCAHRCAERVRWPARFGPLQLLCDGNRELPRGRV